MDSEEGEGEEDPSNQEPVTADRRVRDVGRLMQEATLAKTTLSVDVLTPLPLPAWTPAGRRYSRNLVTM